jgi:hypothetical protein
VLPAPLVSAAPRYPACPRSLPHPATATEPPRRCAPPVSRCARVTHAAASPVHTVPAAVRAARSRLSHAMTAHAAPHLGPSLSAPSPAHTWHQAGPLPFSSPPHRRAAIKTRCPTSSSFHPFSSRKHRCTTPPPPLPSLRCPINPRRPRGAGPHRTVQVSARTALPPPSSVSVARSFDMSQPIAPYSLPSSSKQQGHTPDHRRPPCQLHCRQPSSILPPHRRPTSPVSPLHPRVVQQVPYSVSVLQPPKSLHLAPRRPTGDHVAPGREAVMARYRSRPSHQIGLRPPAGFGPVLCLVFLNRF